MNEMQSAIFLGAMAIAILFISAWMHIKGKDGSGWGFVALILVITSCSRSGA